MHCVHKTAYGYAYNHCTSSVTNDDCTDKHNLRQRCFCVMNKKGILGNLMHHFSECNICTLGNDMAIE